MFSKLNKRMRGEGGFTLIELLVVIIIIAILAAIAIPTFLGQRQKAQDAAAKSLVRNAMTAVESAYVDTRDFGEVDADILLAIEPSIVFSMVPDAATKPGVSAQDNAVAVDDSIGKDAYGVGTTSESGKTFGVIVNKTASAIDGHAPGNTFYIGNDPASW
ncbi:MAG: prepilin-type N-terminal cleavage/methylation domain-containing protein [Gaiellales bacterium]|nr:prepilin-type N-terminal cleavage/methylation domain-containing protein [Gaiellales bacterium]